MQLQLFIVCFACFIMPQRSDKTKIINIQYDINSQSLIQITLDIKFMATKFKVGQEVLVSTKEIQDKKGIIRFIGKIDGKADEYIGVELDEPCGKNNGEVDGKPYFKIQKKTDKGAYGVFVKAISIKILQENKKPVAKPIKTNPPPATTGKNKLSNELLQQQNNELQQTKDLLQNAYERIRQLEELDTVKQIQGLKEKVKEYEEINRSLKLELEQTKYRTDSNQEEKLKELADRLEFFKGQKESAERQRSELKKKIERLQAQLEQGAEREEMLDKLTYKIETLQSKNQKLKSDLEAANTQLKNAEILGTGKSNEQLQQNITTLNEMIALLQSDLNEQKEKNARLQSEMQNSSGRLNELVKLERKLKSKEEEIQTLKIQLEAFSDAASFVEKLTLDLITKEETIREQTKKLKEFAESVNKLQTQASDTHEMIGLQTQQMQSLQDQIQKLLGQKEQQQKHVNLLNDQISKYKQKIRELSDNNSSLLMNLQGREDDNTIIQNYFNVDVYQHKYYELSKLHQATQEQYLQFQLMMGTVRHYSGVFLANLYETLPEQFISNFYPNLCTLLLKITATNHHLYLLFELISQTLTHKSELYTAQQESTIGWFLMLLEQIPELYNSLLKIEIAITSADSEEDIAEIIGHRQLKDQLTRIDVFTQQLLQRIISETIDIEVSIDPYIEPIEILDELSLSIKRLPTELATRHELCVQSMIGVHQILSSIELYRRNSEARQASQVDILLQNFLKLLESYMRECCTNPHIRLKTQMKSFNSGVDLIVKILKEIQVNDNLQELNSLYSQTEDIKMLKDTIMTTQFHLKQLQNDLEQIHYPSPLSRIHVKLPGKLWQSKLKSMKEELARFETTLKEKQELEQIVAEQKKKILILEKDIKDRQATKELHERRIGQLQLKVEQAAFLETDFKRQTEKLKSLQEASKIIEDQLSAQSRRKKELQEELRKTKEKFDIFQTETMMKQKKMKSSTNLSSEDLSNLSIFKSVLSEAGSLRNQVTKQKIHELNFSKLMTQPKAPVKSTNNRRNILASLIDIKYGETTFDNKLIPTELPKASNPELKQISAGKAIIRGGTTRSVCIDLNASSLVTC